MSLNLDRLCRGEVRMLALQSMANADGLFELDDVLDRALDAPTINGSNHRSDQS
jgi:hypothetical protein